MGDERNYFAALPGRATSDAKLTALHFRVLAVIAGHDRMGRNGQFCWAGRAKLAATIGCHPTNFSAAVNELVAWGYLVTKTSETDARQKGFSVVYDAGPDAAGIGIRGAANRLPKPHLNRLPTDHLSPADRLPTDHLSDHENRLPVDHLNREIGGQPTINRREKMARQPTDSVDEFVPRASAPANIFSEADKDIPLKRAGEGAPRATEALSGEQAREGIMRTLGYGAKPGRFWQWWLQLSDDEQGYLQQRYRDGTFSTDDLRDVRLMHALPSPSAERGQDGH